MRKFIFPLLMIGLAAGVVSLRSGAFYSDVASDAGNSIVAGTLLLGENATGTTFCSIAAFVPPGAGEPVPFDDDDVCTSVVENTGTIAGDLYLRIRITNNENGCNAAETDAPADTDCGTGPTEGELGDQLNVVDCDAAPSTGAAAATPCTGTTTLTTLDFTCTLVVAGLANGESYSVAFGLTDASDNHSQSDSAVIDFYYAIVQGSQTVPANCGGPAP